ncbi:MAG: phosphate ABC transporter permease subunit PstC [Shackletoniella antarctica]|uniref:Phosphate transport system permease protein n=1 Tax=Shackletoniella antarctica TaxID=268115 RepID=A0A2W4W2N7_9CYAN|nr:MAG: phosphate ABC transporter permease subunit PstC [Shackletoniella antarctica]
MTADTPSSPPSKRTRTPLEKGLDRLFEGTTMGFALFILLLLVAIGLLILTQAWPAMQEFGLSFLWTSSWNPVEGRESFGVLPIIYGTLVSAAIALLIAVPLGLGTALFLSENFIPLKIRTVLVFMVELLAAIPSVVYGLWGIFVLIPALRWFFDLFGIFFTGPSMLAASLVLSIMILPIITAISRDSLAALPPELRQGSYGLGATRWGTIFRVLVPAAISGIVGGVMLALGRAMGETMAVTMLIGNANTISLSLLDPSNTIASLLANQFAEARGIQVAALMYAAFVLVILTLIVNILADWIVRKLQAKY